MHRFFTPGTIRALVLACLVTLVAGCAPREPVDGRGAGLADATLPAADQARSYGAALGTAFEIGPGLSLLLDPGKLPRGTGDEVRDSIPDEVRQAMLAAGYIQGSCVPEGGARESQAPICQAPIPGYVVRVSDVYRLGRDSLQLHVLIRRYDTPATAPHRAFEFEEAYQLAKLNGDWRVVRKARLARAD